MKVKICGVTTKDDAVWALNYGADFIGLNFYKESPRHVSATTAAKWATTLPPFAQVVGVFVDAPMAEIVKAVTTMPLKGVQLHGSETPEFCAELKEKLSAAGKAVFLIKAFRMESEESLASIPNYATVVDYILLDAAVPGQEGGTGTTFNWDLALKAKELGRPVILAGGLTPENIKAAVKKVMPYAVDVASGVEQSPRRKDLKKVQDFINNAKH